MLEKSEEWGLVRSEKNFEKLAQKLLISYYGKFGDEVACSVGFITK
jgi:hypothetical protein